MSKAKKWVNKNPRYRWVKILFLYLLIAFVIGLTMKLVAASLATAKLVSLMDDRSDTAAAIAAAGVHAPPELIAGHARNVQGVTDQSIGVYVGWAMIALKLYIYSTTFVTLHKIIFKGHEVSKQWLWFMFARFFTLIIGLSVGEGLTVYYTERNKQGGEVLTGQQIFSYISPAVSIAFALVVPPMIYQVIKMHK